MDGASQEEWHITRLAQVSAISTAHFARSFKVALVCSRAAKYGHETQALEPMVGAAQVLAAP